MGPNLSEEAFLSFSLASVLLLILNMLSYRNMALQETKSGPSTKLSWIMRLEYPLDYVRFSTTLKRATFEFLAYSSGSQPKDRVDLCEIIPPCLCGNSGGPPIEYRFAC